MDSLVCGARFRAPHGSWGACVRWRCYAKLICACVWFWGLELDLFVSSLPYNVLRGY